MSKDKSDLDELIAAGKAAKREWEEAMQAVKRVNDRVGKTHAKWLVSPGRSTHRSRFTEI
jgi:hypothetical protein